MNERFLGEKNEYGISLHPDLLSDDPKTRLRMNAALNDMVDSGWIPRDCTDPRTYIIKHECGHTIIGYIYKNEPELFIKIADIILGALQDGTLHKLSTHATSENIFEAFADIYASIYTVPEEVQPRFVKQIYILLQQNQIPVKNSGVPIWKQCLTNNQWE